MKILNFYNVKGGTGKSSLSYLSGLYLAEKGNKVLFLDLDPQASLSNRLLIERPSKTIFNLLAENESPLDCIVSINKNVFLLPSELKLNKVLNGIPENTIRKVLKNLKFDYVIIDNPPSCNSLVISGISASNKIFIPTLLSQNDLDSAYFTLNEVKEINEEIQACIILNRASKKESKEEIDYFNFYNFNSLVVRFQNSTGLKRVIDRGESLDSKRNLILKESIGNLFYESELIVWNI